jgi:hypothetical protein
MRDISEIFQRGRLAKAPIQMHKHFNQNEKVEGSVPVSLKYPSNNAKRV